MAADEALTKLVGDGAGVPDDRPTLDPVTFDELIGGSEPVSQHLVGAYDPAQLARGRLVVEAIWRAHEADTKGDAAEVDRWIAKGLAIELHNAYLRFLELSTSVR